MSMAAAGLAAAILLLGSGCENKRDEGFEPVESPPYESQEWSYGRAAGRQLTTEHYHLLTTVEDENLLTALPQVLETCFVYYSYLVPTASPPGQRMQIYLFATRGQFESFTRRMFPQRAELLLRVRRGGYTEDGIAVIEYVSHQTTFPIIAHEGFHQYAHFCIRGRIPAWLNEGLAVLCEGYRMSGSGVFEFDGWYNPLRRNTLIDIVQRRRDLPLPELLRMNAGHVVGGPARTVGAYYSQLWALLLFVQEGEDGKYADGFRRLLDTVGTQDMEAYAQAAYVTSSAESFNFGEALFSSFISDDLSTVAAEYQRFVEQRIMGGRSDR